MRKPEKWHWAACFSPKVVSNTWWKLGLGIEMTLKILNSHRLWMSTNCFLGNTWSYITMMSLLAVKSTIPNFGSQFRNYQFSRLCKSLQTRSQNVFFVSGYKLGFARLQVFSCVGISLLIKKRLVWLLAVSIIQKTIICFLQTYYQMDGLTTFMPRWLSTWVKTSCQGHG